MFLGIVALGQSLMVMARGEGIDLSVGSALSLGVCISSSLLLGKDANIPAALLATLAAGLVSLFHKQGSQKSEVRRQKPEVQEAPGRGSVRAGVGVSSRLRRRFVYRAGLAPRPTRNLLNSCNSCLLPSDFCLH